MNRQVEAMETEDFGSLGQPVFARGFVRNYARLLGLDANALLQVMGGANVQPVDIVQTQPVVLPGAWFTSKWLIAGLLALLLFTVVPIALYAWLSSDSEEVSRVRPQALQHPATVAAPISSPVMIEPKSEPPIAKDTTATSVGGLSATAPTVTPASTQSVTKREMHFEFDDNAWVEIKDGTGQVLQHQMNSKGTTLELSGQPPFSLVLGNATKMRMTYNGRALDLKPYIDANVARFSLEE
jgi:cytoskeleton protein RodZ